MSDAGPKMPEAIRKAFGRLLSGIHTSIPARIEAYDAASCKASVAPCVGSGVRGEDGEREVEYLAVIQNVPVLQLGTKSLGVCIKIEPAVGDYVMLLISEVSLDRWKARGGRVDAGDDRRFDITDAVALPGLFDFGSVADAAAMIEITATEVKVGGTSAVAAIKGPDFQSDHAQLLSVLSAFAASFVATGPLTAAHLTAAGNLATAIADYLLTTPAHLTTIAKVT